MIGFLQACPSDLQLQKTLRQAGSLQEVIQLAQAVGYPIELRELQLWAHCPQFDAPWWPWASLDAAGRVRFLREGR